MRFEAAAVVMERGVGFGALEGGYTALGGYSILEHTLAATRQDSSALFLAISLLVLSWVAFVKPRRMREKCYRHLLYVVFSVTVQSISRRIWSNVHPS